jgi:hypothetical protein
MRTRNRNIVPIWKDILIKGIPGNKGFVENHQGSLTLWADGKIYSYRLLIGEIKQGIHILYDHTRKGGSYHSKTTTSHVNLFRETALKVVNYND